MQCVIYDVRILSLNLPYMHNLHKNPPKIFPFIARVNKIVANINDSVKTKNLRKKMRLKMKPIKCVRNKKELEIAIERELIFYRRYKYILSSEAIRPHRIHRAIVRLSHHYLVAS